jgi:Ca-activated chloride channel family protein
VKGMNPWPLSLALVLASSAQAGWFANAEQEAEARFKQGDYAGAAEGSADPYRQGVALYRAGRHAEAADALRPQPEAQAGG